MSKIAQRPLCPLDNFGRKGCPGGEIGTIFRWKRVISTTPGLWYTYFGKGSLYRFLWRCADGRGRRRGVRLLCGRCDDMDEFRYVNITLDAFCALLSMLPVLCLISNRRYRQKLNQYFLGVCISNIIMIAGDLPDWLLPTAKQAWQRLVLTAATTVYYGASAFVLLFFILYIVDYLQIPARRKKISLAYAGVLCAVQVAFSLASPFTGALFLVTENGYQRGPMFFVSQLDMQLGYLLFMVLVLIYRKKLLAREVVFFLLYIFIPVGCGVAQMLVRGIAVINASITVSILIILMNVQFEHEVTLKEQEKELAERRIDIMLSQIQPHFLYNCLGTIHRLCEKDPETARKAIRKFSDFLRGNMDSLKNRELIAFGAELNHVANYLYLEQQRFGDKLQIIYQIKTEDFMIPPLTLQPLVENAVQHGILNRRGGGTIVISTENTDRYVVIKVADNGVGMEKAKERPLLGNHLHIGIANVRSRLEQMVDGSLQIESSSQGTTATIHIPWTGGMDR